MMISRRQSVHRPILGGGSAEVAKVSAVVHVEPRHFVKAHDRIEPMRRGCSLHLIKKSAIANVVATDTTRGEDVDAHSVGLFPLPLGGININRMPPLLAFGEDAQKIPLKTAVGKVFIKTER